MGGYQIRKFRTQPINNPSRVALIAKTFFLAETFYRYRMRILRDHGIQPAQYPGGYL